MPRTISPLSAVYATSRPPTFIAWNTRFPEVVRVPPPVAPPPRPRHTSFCVAGFHAIRNPPRCPAGTGGPIVGPAGAVAPRPPPPPAPPAAGAAPRAGAGGASGQVKPGIPAFMHGAYGVKFGTMVSVPELLAVVGI